MEYPSKNFSKNPHSNPLLSWDAIFSQRFSEVEALKDYQELLTYIEREDWEIDIDLLQKLREGHCMVLTDLKQQIKWTCRKFSRATGYSFAEVKNQTPKMLQGELTSPETIEEIRHKLAMRKEAKVRIINYRKDQSPYMCQLHIHPIFNKKGNVVRYLAIEFILPYREEKER